MASGFNFGAKTTAPPAFGTGSITFGTPATQTQPSFGLNAPQTTQPIAVAFQLGTTQATTATPSLFGTQPAVNFNKPTGFAMPTAQTFGAPTSSTGGLQFGTQAATTSSAPATGFGFGTTSTPSLLGTSTSSAAPLTFGATPASTASTGLSFGTLTSTAISTASLNFGFGSSASTANVLNLGASATTTTSKPSFGLGGTVAPQQPQLSATSSAPTLGLGGLATTQTKLTTTQKELPPKEQPLPNEILQTVEQFKEMVKQQKLYSSDIARCSIREFRKVEQEIDHLTNLLNDVEGQLQKNRQLAEKLKYDTAKCLQNVEMAQRTQDTPPGLQYENTAPLRYFLELADQFEREMQVLKFQIESADKYVKNHKSPDTITPQDLALGMRRLHETFVALAGRLQAVHSQVESQKETYLNIRKQIYNDHTNPFEKLAKINHESVNHAMNASRIYSPPKVATGPTPFTNLPLGNGNLSMLHQNQPNSGYGVATTSATPSVGFGSMSFGSNLTTQASNTSLFGSAPFGQSSFNTSFQLQKPPTGNKRGKQ